MAKKPLKERIKDSKFADFVRTRVKPVAGDVLELVGDVTGIEAIERVGEIINSKKENSQEARNLAHEFEKYKLEWELEMHRIDVQNELESYRAEVEDRKSARDREARFIEATGGKRDWLMGAVVITGLALLVVTIFTLVYVQIPADNQRLADMCFGAVMSMGASIFSYYVGSSKSSRIKDETINHAVRYGE